MFGQQRKPGFGMVECGIEIARRFPCRLVVAGIAVGRKRAVVRVLMTGDALLEGDSDIADARLSGLGGRRFEMTFGASDALVRAHQRIPGSGMVETGDVLPSGHHVAAIAGGPQLALMLVLMAGGAIAAQAQIGTLHVLEQDGAPGSGRDVFRIVALGALEPRVAALQGVAGFPMIELIEAHVPANGDEILAVMIGVALDALRVRRSLLQQRRMEATIFGNAPADFGVAGEAAKLPFAAPAHVATGAVSGTVECVMRLGQSAGRELGPGRGGACQQQQNFQQHGNTKLTIGAHTCPL